MKKWKLTILTMSTLLISGCSIIPSKASSLDKIPSQLWQITSSIFASGPQNPRDARGEFETSDQYRERLDRQYRNYIVEADKYYGEKESEFFTLLQEIEVLDDYNPDQKFFEIRVTLRTVENYLGDVVVGPDFELWLPPQAKEKIHLFDETFYGDEVISVQNGALAKVVFYAYVPPETARRIRGAFEDKKITLLMRLDLNFLFPKGFEGYRFHPKDLRDRDSDLIDQDAEYGKSEGKITIRVVLAKLVDDNGNEFHQWPSALILAQETTTTPTPAVTAIANLDLTPAITSTSTSVFESESSICPGAPEIRVQVGQKVQVTYGDHPSYHPPRLLRYRSEPSGSILGILKDGTSMEILDGPVCKDGFVWWRVKVSERLASVWVAEGEPNWYYIEPSD